VETTEASVGRDRRCTSARPDEVGGREELDRGRALLVNLE